MGRTSLVGGLLAGALALVGCSEAARETPPTGQQETTRPQRVPLTDRGSAVAVVEVVGEPVTARPADHHAPGLPEGTVGSDLTFADGLPGIRVRVSPGALEVPCDRARCATLPTRVEGGTLRMMWQERTEHDPGFLYVGLWLADQTVVVEAHGVPITRDPRDQDLAWGVDDLARIVESPQLRLETYRYVERAGAEITTWEEDSGAS